MQILNTNPTGQSIRAIFRDGEVYSRNQLQVLVRKQGTKTVETFNPAEVDYYPNFCEVTINLTDVTGNYVWKDGEEYDVRITGNGNLLYRDTIFVSENAFDSTKLDYGSDKDDYKTNRDNQSNAENDFDDRTNDYIILDN